MLPWREIVDHPFLLLHEGAFITSRWADHLSSLLLRVSVWISGGSGDKATFSSPLLHNCLSDRSTQGLVGCWGGAAVCTLTPLLSCCTTISLAALHHFFINSVMYAVTYAFIKQRHQIKQALLGFDRNATNDSKCCYCSQTTSTSIITAKKNSPCKHRKHISKHGKPQMKYCCQRSIMPSNSFSLLCGWICGAWCKLERLSVQ